MKLPDYLEKSGLTPILHPWKLPYPGKEPEPQGPILITENPDNSDETKGMIVDCRNKPRDLGSNIKPLL
jgi:hypothetical protein